MTIFRIYSDKDPDCFGAGSFIKDVVVIANSEEQALEIVKKRFEEDFICDFEEVNIIAFNSESAKIINVQYFDDIHY